MMKGIEYLILLMLSPHIWGAEIRSPYPYLFPTSFSDTLEQFNWTSHKCNPLGDQGENHPKRFPIYLPFRKPHLVSGVFCRKFDEVITCTTGMSGFSFSVLQKPERISHAECEEAVNKGSSGSLPPISTVYPKCSVGTEQSAHNIHIALEPATVSVDIQTDSIIHHYFNPHACQMRSCETVHPNIWWIGDKHLAGDCVDLERSAATYYPDGDGQSEGGLLDTPYSPVQSMRGGCRGMTYCSIPSYVLPGGFIVVPAGKEAEDLLGELTLGQPECQSGRKFKEITMYDISLNTDLSTLIDHHHQKCLGVLSQLASRRGIHNGDLIYLSRAIPGDGDGYLIDDHGSLMKVRTRFEMVEDFDVDCPKRDRCRIQYRRIGEADLHTLHNRCFPPPPEMTVGGNSTCLWLNGISFSPSRIYYPHDLYEERLSESYMEALHSGIEYSPRTPVPDTDTGISDDSEAATTNTTYSSWWDRVLRWIGVRLGGLIILCLLFAACRLYSFCMSCKQGGGNKTEIIMMGDLGPKGRVHPGDRQDRASPVAVPPDQGGLIKEFF